MRSFAPHELGKRRYGQAVRLLAANAHAQRIRQLVGGDSSENEPTPGKKCVGVRRRVDPMIALRYEG